MSIYQKGTIFFSLEPLIRILVAEFSSQIRLPHTSQKVGIYPTDDQLQPSNNIPAEINSIRPNVHIIKLSHGAEWREGGRRHQFSGCLSAVAQTVRSLAIGEIPTVTDC